MNITISLRPSFISADKNITANNKRGKGRETVQEYNKLANQLS